MNKFLVCYGEKIVELHKHGLDKEEATTIAQSLMAKGLKNVRVRMEDPNHPSWPLNFDLREAK